MIEIKSIFESIKIYMFGQGSQQDTRITFEKYWNQMTIGYKYFLCIILTWSFLGIFTNLFRDAFANYLYFTVNKIQIWRLFTSFLVDQSILNALINLYVLSSFLPNLEKMYSTAYLIVEIIIQNLYCNLIFIIFGQILALIGIVDSKTLFNCGLMNLLFIFLWQRVAKNPQEMTRFCCLPCIMPLKYLPWCFLVLLTILGGSSSIIGCLLGHYQHMFLQRPLVQIQLKFYYKIENWLPKAMKESSGFVKISSVQANLRSICHGSSQEIPYAQQMNDRVDAVESGVAIGGSSQSQKIDYRQHWQHQEEQDEMILSSQERSIENDIVKTNQQKGDHVSQNIKETFTSDTVQISSNDLI